MVKPPPPAGKPVITIVVRCEPAVVVAVTGMATPAESSGTHTESMSPSVSSLTFVVRR